MTAATFPIAEALFSKTRRDVLEALTYAAWRAEEKELPLAS
jgi:hypothetical protein